MTKDEERLVSTIRGYLEAKKESGKTESIPYHQIASLKMAIDALEIEIQSITYCAACQNAEMTAMTATIKNYWKEIETLKEKLKEKTYPIDREYREELRFRYLNRQYKEWRNKSWAEKEELKNKNDLQRMQIDRLQTMVKEMDKGIVNHINQIGELEAETKELKDKVGLQAIEIGKLQGILKEADEEKEKLKIKNIDMQKSIEGLQINQNWLSTYEMGVDDGKKKR